MSAFYDVKRFTEEVPMLRNEEVTVFQAEEQYRGLVTKSNALFLELDGKTIIPWNSIRFIRRGRE